MNTSDAIANFEKTLKANSSKEKDDFNDFAEKILEIKKVNPPVYEKDKINAFLTKRAAAMSNLLDKYVQAFIGKEYPRIHASLFDYKRYLYIDGNNKLVKDVTEEVDDKEKMKKAQVPLFIHCPLDKQSVPIGKYQKRTDYSHYTYTISANLPKPPRDIIAKANTAMATFHKMMSKIYSDERVNDLVSKTLTPEFGALWIPTSESLSVKAEVIRFPKPKVKRVIDPALVMTINEEIYVIGTWAIKEEHAFEHFLKEFTV